MIAVKATSKVTFAYVVTGDAAADETSRRGLIGLGKFLTQKTAVEPGEPFAVNIETDEIAFFPMIYWPVLPNARPLSPAVLAKIDAYMKQGGMIIFDTKDHGQGVPTGYNLRGDGTTPLQRMLGGLDIPRLEPVPEHHVLDEVVLPAALLPRALRGRLPVGGGGDAARQRPGPAGAPRRRGELDPHHLQRLRLGLGGRRQRPAAVSGRARRRAPARDGLPVGVNIIMYVLTGNYKADLVHVPALLERLGQ